MKLKIIGIIIATLFVLFGCTGEPTEREDFILRVNSYTISGDEVDSSLKIEAELSSNFYPTEDTRTEYLKDLIQSQLLIQEAKRQNLDQSELFRQTIQRYWESTLIRDLLASKSEQLRKTTVVSEKEIEEFYSVNKEYLSDAPFEEMKEELAKKVEDKKVTARLQAWIGELKSNAIIEIKDAELARKIKESRDG